MQKLLIALLMSLYGGVAFAADALDDVIIVENPTNWSGLYIGGHAGWVGVDQGATSNPQPAGFGEPAIIGVGLAGGGFTPSQHNLDSDSFGGGVYAGYNWQHSNIVYGAEVDLTVFRHDEENTQTFTDTCCGGSVFPQTTVHASNDWVGSVRGRVGYTTGNWLLYATGGLAFTETHYNSFLTPDGVAFSDATTATSSQKKTTAGGVVGIGLEMLLRNNWVLRTEYDYYHISGGSAAAPVVGQDCPNCRFKIDYDDIQIHSVKAGLAYKF
ncbi:outer membrane beta-barrel protein [Mesorhizobium sp. M0589]|uniref:outer membrane protein n=1 Tax=Mesorhizobium sp. M0589 TaxID=2956965 RepID=UPI00333D6D46